MYNPPKSPGRRSPSSDVFTVAQKKKLRKQFAQLSQKYFQKDFQATVL
jgi:hypothetical protein